jgi:hypothetical protein
VKKKPVAKAAQPKAAQPKPLQPKTGETHLTGNEPLWSVQPTPDQRQMALTRALAWYNYYCDSKDARKFVIDWLARDDKLSRLARDMGRVPERHVGTTLGWLCRMSVMGLELNERERLFIGDRIHRLIMEHQEPEVVDKPRAVDRPNIQDHLRTKMREVAGELEGIFDDMLQTNSRFDTVPRAVNLLREHNISPQMVGEIAEHWTGVKAELEQAAKGQDADLVEGYRNRTKIQLRNMIRFADQVIADCASYVQLKKVERKPRKKKPVSPEKITARFKYLREFAELGLKSVSVTDLVNAQEAWLYDTKRRKLIYVVHEDLAGSFTVKGSALIGIDTTNSVRKTLRKPKEQLKALMTVGAPAARKVFKEIRSTETQFNGRGNEHMIILKVR